MMILNGRISLFTSIGFGFGGLLIVYRIAPFAEGIVDSLSSAWIEVLALFFTILFTVDMTLTVSALTRFEEMVIYAEKSFDGKMGDLVENAQNRMYYFGRSGKQAIRRVNKFRYMKINNEKLNHLL